MLPAVSPPSPPPHPHVSLAQFSTNGMYVSFHSQNRSVLAATHLSACGLLAKRHRIYALNVGKAVGGGPLPGEASGLRRRRCPRVAGGGVAEETSPFARRSASWPGRGFTSREAVTLTDGAVWTAVPSSCCAKWAFCPRRQLLQKPTSRPVQRVQEGDRAFP